MAEKASERRSRREREMRRLRNGGREEGRKRRQEGGKEERLRVATRTMVRGA